MKAVPNPFWLGDQFILDWVCNPLCWKMELQYGKDGGDLVVWALGVYYAGAGLYLSFWIPYSAVLMLPIMVSTWTMRDELRQLYRYANRLGVNPLRGSLFLPRVSVLVSGFVLCFVHVADSSVLAELCVMLAMIGLVSGFYFMSTDTMPPGYHERKVAPRFA